MPRRRAERPTLTIKTVEAALKQARANGKPSIVWCGMTAGFGAKCLPTGHVAWLWQGDVARRTRRITLNRQGDLTLAQARMAAAEVASRVALGENVPDARVERRVAEKLTLRALTALFFEERGAKLRDRTRTDYQVLLQRNVLPRLAARPAHDLTEADVAQVHASITARGAGRQANYTVAVIRAVYSWAVRRKLVANNPARGIELNPEHHRERFASPDEIGRLREALAGMEDRSTADAITLLLLTGARSGEILNATWSQFDLGGDGDGDLGGAGAVWTKPALSTKQKRVHRLPLSREAADILRTRRRTHPGLPDAYVFPNAAGGRISDRNFAKRWTAIREAAGLHDFKKHDLRHTAASILAAQGASLPLIGAVLGHSTPITTSRYAHLVDGATRAAMDQIAAAVNASVARSPRILSLPLNRKPGSSGAG